MNCQTFLGIIAVAPMLRIYNWEDIWSKQVSTIRFFKADAMSVPARHRGLWTSLQVLLPFEGLTSPLSTRWTFRQRWKSTLSSLNSNIRISHLQRPVPWRKSFSPPLHDWFSYSIHLMLKLKVGAQVLDVDLNLGTSIDSQQGMFICQPGRLSCAASGIDRMEEARPWKCRIQPKQYRWVTVHWRTRLRWTQRIWGHTFIVSIWWRDEKQNAPVPASI